MTNKYMLVSNLVNPDSGKTYREENAEKQHNIPLDMLVELDSGVRLFVVHHGRDCDMTPLYSLAVDKNDTAQKQPGFYNYGWHNGYTEESLKIVSENSNSIGGKC